MSTPLSGDLLSSHTNENTDLLQITLKATQLTLPELYFSGCQISENATIDDYHLKLVARDVEGKPLPEWTLDIELYTAGTQLSIMIERQEQPDYPILWQGQYPVWMDAESGTKVDSPPDGESLERLARRLQKKLRV